MKILSAGQIREWDEYTIQHEPIASVDLMERAASACVDWLETHDLAEKRFIVFAGKGNNGGDGLAIARMLSEKEIAVSVYILEFGHKGTDDFQINLARLHQHPAVDIRFLQAAEHFPALSGQEIIIDAILGSGINRPVEGLTASLISYMNQSGCKIVAVDIPSGLFTDHSSKGNITVQATHTLSFQCYKPALLMAENATAIGDVTILDIGLHSAYYDQLCGTPELVDDSVIQKLYRPVSRFAHKGHFGHALLIAGSYGKMGAAVLAIKSCLRSGAGLVTGLIPRCGYTIIQSSVPEAMVHTDAQDEYITTLPGDLDRYRSVGAGPGLGNNPATVKMLGELMQSYRGPVVYDADALNMMAQEKSLLKLISPGAVLTPHPKEFDRLFGESQNDVERIEKAVENARLLNTVIVLKGHHTLVVLPGGQQYFNSTGNAGMAKGGSGDVLTGILTGLIARGYPSADAAILGVYLHGLAADIAVKSSSCEALVATDIIACMGNAWRYLQH